MDGELATSGIASCVRRSVRNDVFPQSKQRIGFFGFDDVRDGNVVVENGVGPRSVGVRFQRAEADVDVVRAILHRGCFPVSNF